MTADTWPTMKCIPSTTPSSSPLSLPIHGYPTVSRIGVQFMDIINYLINGNLLQLSTFGTKKKMRKKHNNKVPLLFYFFLNRACVLCPSVCRKDIPARRVRRWAFSVEELLKDPVGRDHFAKFLEKEFSGENLRYRLSTYFYTKPNTCYILKLLHKIILFAQILGKYSRLEASSHERGMNKL